MRCVSDDMLTGEISACNDGDDPVPSLSRNAFEGATTREYDLSENMIMNLVHST